MPLVIGVDSSTQSTKVEIRDLDEGTVVAAAKAPHPPTSPPCSEQHPAAWWAALAEAIAATGHTRLAAIAIGGQQHGLVPLDEHAAVIRPAKLWNDTESAVQSAALIEQYGAADWATECGSVPVPAFTITKLAWLAAHEPAHFERLRTVLLPHDWLTAQLTGELTTDRGDASGTGYWSPSQNRWRPDLLARLTTALSESDWAAVLPTVLGPTEAAGHIRPVGAEQLGLAGTALVGPGTGDNMAGALGVALAPGDVVVSLGTSGTVYTVSEVPTADPSGAVAGFADATGRYLPLVCTLNATQVTDAVARLLGVDLAELDHLATIARPGAGGVVLLPYLNGERTPNRPSATGVITGLRSDVSRDQLARAAYEGVVCALLDGIDALAAAGVPTQGGRLVLVGGGARSSAYRQILADLAQRPVMVPSADELVAAGACVQAAATLSGAAPLDVAIAWGLATGTEVEPDLSVDATAIRAAYAELRESSVLTGPPVA